MSFASLPHPITPVHALLANRSIRRILEQIVPVRDLARLTFAALAIPRKGNATMIMQRVSNTCDDAPLLPPILASLTAPGVFSPMIIAGRHYAESDLLDNGGISAAGMQRVAVMSIVHGGVLAQLTSTVLGVMARSFHLIITGHAREAIQRYQTCADFLIIDHATIHAGSLLGFAKPPPS